MQTVIVTAEVEDANKWEEGFRTHGDLFRSQSIRGPIRFAAMPNNHVVIRFDVDDIDEYMKGMDSAATADAMAFDGVKRDTVKIYPLDKEFPI